jgi:hypothetical protein
MWGELCSKSESSTQSKDEEKLYKKWGKAMALLANDPKHPGLHSHEIEALSHRYGSKVWQSYLENRNPSATRIYWVYGPVKAAITIIGLEPHPEDKKNKVYAKVKLSATG